MPTENPKISAYVPQVVYDRFKKFQEERGLSMSQAAIEIFVQYFGIDLAANSTQEFTGGLQAKIEQVQVNVEQVEQRLSEQLFELKQFFIELSQQVVQGRSTSELAQDELVETLTQPTDVILGEPLSNLPDSLLIKASSDTFIPSSELPNSEIDRENLQLELIDSSTLHDFESNSELLSKPLDELNILSLAELKLASRLNIERSTIRYRRGKFSVEKFADMTKTSDPDLISWTYSEELKKYVPYGDLSNYQVESLKIWKKGNSK